MKEAEGALYVYIDVYKTRDEATKWMMRTVQMDECIKIKGNELCIVT